jgi:peroxiredoxin
MAKTPEQIEVEWDANVKDVQDSKQALLDATFALVAVENAVAEACGRQRFPTVEELAQLDEARAVYDAAKVTVNDAKVKFKAGVKD